MRWGQSGEWLQKKLGEIIVEIEDAKEHKVKYSQRLTLTDSRYGDSLFSSNQDSADSTRHLSRLRSGPQSGIKSLNPAQVSSLFPQSTEKAPRYQTASSTPKRTNKPSSAMPSGRVSRRQTASQRNASARPRSSPLRWRDWLMRFLILRT